MKLLITHGTHEGLRLAVIEHVDVPLILPEVSTWYEDDGVQASRTNTPEEIDASRAAHAEALNRDAQARVHPIHVSSPSSGETLVVTDIPEVTVRARAPGLLLFETRMTLVEDITSEVAIWWECEHPSYNAEAAGDINFPAMKAVCSRCGSILLSRAGTFPIQDAEVERTMGRKIPTLYEALGLDVPLTTEEIQEAERLAQELDPDKDDRLLTSEDMGFVDRILHQYPSRYDREDLNRLRALAFRRRGTNPIRKS